MINELFVINSGGQLLFSWHPENKDEEDMKDDLVSGFLSALNTFATMERGEDIKSLKLKETTIIFEKYEELNQEITFVATTKDDNLIELIHAIIHELMESFVTTYKEKLERPFDGDVTDYYKYDKKLEEIFIDYGLDILKDSIKLIDQENYLKSIIFLEPGGNLLYLHAKQYVNKEKISFLVPLLINSSQLLYLKNLNQELGWLLFSTREGETLLVEIRRSMFIAKLYSLGNSYGKLFAQLDFIDSESKYVKKPKKLVEKFSNIIYDKKIQDIYLVDMLGKVFYEKTSDNKKSFKEFIPEAISFLTSSKRASKEIFNKPLFFSTIGGSETTTICINFDNFALIFTGAIQNFVDYEEIATSCSNIIKQL